jgi:fatty acid desaturase
VLSAETRLRALRRELYRRFPVRPRVYALDLAASVAAAWGAGVLATVLPLGWALPVVVAGALATYRAAYFVHEIAHVRRALPGFEPAWNLTVGAFVAMPSYMVMAHVDHHRLDTYGTALDPEYEPVAGWGRARVLASVAVMPLLPPVLALRALVLVPVSWLWPAWRRVLHARLSTLQTNALYVRSLSTLRGPAAVLQEVLAALVLSGALALLVAGALPWRAALVWWAMTGLALTVNQVRTLFAHAYANDGSTLSLAAQVADSTTVDGGWLAALTHPVGTRFHALHHLAPSLPYHALGAAHRWLLAAQAPAAYGQTARSGFVDGCRRLWARAAARDRAARRHDQRPEDDRRTWTAGRARGVHPDV